VGHLLGRLGGAAQLKKPLPRITPDNEPFHAALRERRFLLPRCSSCEKHHLPPGPVCPYCFSDDIRWREASGRGKVSSWTVVHKAWFPAFQDDIPYNVVQVELEEGPRLTANVVEIGNRTLRIGMPVEVVYDAASAELAMVRFRPLKGGG
jgi:uncharacterized OB-fold protein